MIKWLSATAWKLLLVTHNFFYNENADSWYDWDENQRL